MKPFREDTRLQRYEKKKSKSITYPLSLVAYNLVNEVNIGQVFRSAACFGAKEVVVIGSLPLTSSTNSMSGTTLNLTPYRVFPSHMEFLEEEVSKSDSSSEWFLDNELVAIEICDGAKSLDVYDFNFWGNQHTYLIVGHETLGIPGDFLQYCNKVYIPMDGYGYCLNTAMALSIVTNEYCRQMRDKKA